MAKVVFSDGSKAMAHNLDDLYERWLLRKEEEQLIRKVQLPEVMFVDYTSPSSLEEAEKWVIQLQNRRGEIQAKLAQKRWLDESGRTFAKYEYNVARATLVAELEYIIAVRRLLKGFLKIKTRLPYRKLAAAVEGEAPGVFALKQAYKLLCSLSEDERVTYSEEEQAILDFIADRLTNLIEE